MKHPVDPQPFQTSRLRADPMMQEHAESMFRVLSDESIYAFLPQSPPASVRALRDRYAAFERRSSPDGSEGWLNWRLALRTSGDAIGFVQATIRRDHASIAYVLHADHRGQGLGREACLALLERLFRSEDVEAVRAEIHEDNERSIRLVHQLGFAAIGFEAEERDLIFELNRARFVGLAKW